MTKLREKLKRIPKMMYFRIISLVCCVVFPIFLAMTLFNLYSIHVVEEQVGDSVRSTLSVYMSQVDIQLETLRQDIVSVSVNNEDVLIMDRSGPGNQRTLAKVRLTNKLKQYLVIYNLMDMAFYYNPTQKVRTAVYDTSLPFETRQSIWNYMKETYTPTGARSNGGWNYVEIDGALYLLFVSPSKNGMIGAIIGFDRLIEPLLSSEGDFHGRTLLASDAGEPLMYREWIEENQVDLSRDYGENYISGVDRDYLVVGMDSEESDVALVCVINEDNLLEGLPQLHTTLLLLCGTAALGIILLLTTMRRVIIMPLRILVDAMRGFGNGNLDTTIHEPAASEEMELVYSSFNSMSQEIKELKIEVYEERLKKQKTELQYLQLQINPHFYINCINIIHNLAEQKNYALIQEMATLLSNYFRCMFADDMSFVTLSGELYQIEQYLGIQRLRYPDCFTYEIDIPEYLGTTKLPRFVLMTFVENALKHGISREHVLHISLSATLSLIGTVPAMQIVVRDNGGGFSPELLRQLQQEVPSVAAESGHIGINNAIQRLELLYGKRHVLKFQNLQGGAEVTLIVPLESEEAGE